MKISDLDDNDILFCDGSRNLFNMAYRPTGFGKFIQASPIPGRLLVKVRNKEVWYHYTEVHVVFIGRVCELEG